MIKFYEILKIYFGVQDGKFVYLTIYDKLTTETFTITRFNICKIDLIFLFL